MNYRDLLSDPCEGAMLPIIIALFVLLLWIVHAINKNKSRSTPVPKVVGNGYYAVEVVGANNYLASFEKIYCRHPFSGANVNLPAYLIFEGNDLNDKSPVRVLIRGYTVGYLPIEAARDLREAVVCVGLAHRRIFECPAFIRSGWEQNGGRRCQYGVWLDLPMGSVVQR